jgi:hypothetical protein
MDRAAVPPEKQTARFHAELRSPGGGVNDEPLIGRAGKRSQMIEAMGEDASGSTSVRV